VLKGQGVNDATEIMRDILIVQLGVADVKQEVIRSIARCNMARVNRIVKQLKKAKKAKGD